MIGLIVLTALAFFAVAALLGLYQVVERIDLVPALKSPELYFGSVSTHGVLMGFVLTTFFIAGYGYYTASTSLKQELWNKPLAWFGFLLSLAGVPPFAGFVAKFMILRAAVAEAAAAVDLGLGAAPDGTGRPGSPSPASAVSKSPVIQSAHE